MIKQIQLQGEKTKEIINLHNQIVINLKRSLSDAIRIGELLCEQKEQIGHGGFTAWIQVNLPFSDRTARNYMLLFKNKEKLKSETVSDLNEAYKLLASKDNDNSGVDYEKIELDIYQQCGFSDLDGPSREIAALSLRWYRLKGSADVKAVMEFMKDSKKLQDKANEMCILFGLEIGKMLKDIEGDLSPCPYCKIEIKLISIENGNINLECHSCGEIKYNLVEGIYRK